MEFGKMFLIALMSFGLLLAGCVQPQSQATPTPQATVEPTVEENPVEATPTPAVETNQDQLQAERIDNGGTKVNTATMRVTGPSSFEITASVFSPTPCSITTAKLDRNSSTAEITFQHSKNQDEACAEVLEQRTFKITLNLPLDDLTKEMKKIEISNNRNFIAGFQFDGLYCGGVGEYQCPYGFACKLEEDVGDASGKCVPEVELQPTPNAAGCMLMRNGETGEVTCFGCGATICKDPTGEFQPYEPEGIGIPYSCFDGPNGCELAQ